MAVAGRILVYGGKGALGSVIVSSFKARNFLRSNQSGTSFQGVVRRTLLGEWVGSVDLAPNEQADGNIVVKSADSWTDQVDDITKNVGALLGDNKLDAVLCVAGGWAGGNAASKEFVKNADTMWKQSVWSSAIAASLAVKHLREGGLIALPGAQAAIGGTPGMIGYGMAKAAVHQLVKSLAGNDSGLPKDSTAVAILPVTLDTPMNRKWMPKADHSTWTPLAFVADLFAKWINNEDRPESGSLVQLITKNSNTELVIV